MAIVQCENSHYYDNEKYRECPHCAEKARGGGEEDSVTVAAAHQARQVENYVAEYLKRNAGSGRVHVAIPAGEEEEKTVSIYAKRGTAKYTAGWLVCVGGAEYGRDFPLYAGFNRIGRGPENDISLNDMQVSRDEHCSVIYEEKKNVFFLVPKAGNLTYADEELAEQAQPILNGQILTLGETRLELVVYCAGDKRWKKEN